MTDVTKPSKLRHWRAWVNQPSTLQPRHHLHGKRCVVIDDGGIWVTVMFLEGDLISTEIERSALSELDPRPVYVKSAYSAR